MRRLFVLVRTENILKTELFETDGVTIIILFPCLSFPQTQIQECFPLCQRFRTFRSEFKWKGSFRFLPTGILGITSGGGPLISVGIFRPKFAVPFLTNRFFALIKGIRKRNKNGKVGPV